MSDSGDALRVKCDQSLDCNQSVSCPHYWGHRAHADCRAKVCGYRKHYLGRKPYTVRCVPVPVKGDDDE